MPALTGGERYRIAIERGSRAQMADGHTAMLRSVNHSLTRRSVRLKCVRSCVDIADVLGESGISQRLLAIASVAAYVVARRIAGPLMPTQFLIMLIVLEFVVQPVSTLIHELGHAAAARRVSTGPVNITVGRGPFLSFTIERVRVNFSFLPSRGVMIRGLCTSDVRGVSWRDRAMIALAGPIATFLELIVGIGIVAGLWAHAGLLARNLMLLSLIGLATSVIVNLVPRSAGVIANDGAQALAALARHRRREPVPTGPLATTSGTRETSEAMTPAPADPSTTAPVSIRAHAGHVSAARGEATLQSTEEQRPLTALNPELGNVLKARLAADASRPAERPAVLPVTWDTSRSVPPPS